MYSFHNVFEMKNNSGFSVSFHFLLLKFPLCIHRIMFFMPGAQNIWNFVFAHRNIHNVDNDIIGTCSRFGICTSNYSQQSALSHPLCISLEHSNGHPPLCGLIWGFAVSGECIPGGQKQRREKHRYETRDREIEGASVRDRQTMTLNQHSQILRFKQSLLLCVDS